MTLRKYLISGKSIIINNEKKKPRLFSLSRKRIFFSGFLQELVWSVCRNRSSHRDGFSNFLQFSKRVYLFVDRNPVLISFFCLSKKKKKNTKTSKRYQGLPWLICLSPAGFVEQTCFFQEGLFVLRTDRLDGPARQTFPLIAFFQTRIFQESLSNRCFFKEVLYLFVEQTFYLFKQILISPETLI